MFKSRHLAVELMCLIRDAGPTGIAFDEMLKSVFASEERVNFYGSLEDASKYLRSLLDEMARADILRKEDEGEMPSKQHWWLNAAWFGGSGGIDGPSRPGNEGGGNEEGWGGLREVLGHQLLFSLPSEEFDDAIARSLGAE